MGAPYRRVSPQLRRSARAWRYKCATPSGESGAQNSRDAGGSLGLVVREVAYGAGQRKFEPGSCLPLLRGHTPGDTVRCLYNRESSFLRAVNNFQIFGCAAVMEDLRALWKPSHTLLDLGRSKSTRCLTFHISIGNVGSSLPLTMPI